MPSVEDRLPGARRQQSAAEAGLFNEAGPSCSPRPPETELEGSKSKPARTLIATPPTPCRRSARSHREEDANDGPLAGLADLDARPGEVVLEPLVVVDQTTQLELGHGCWRRREGREGQGREGGGFDRQPQVEQRLPSAPSCISGDSHCLWLFEDMVRMRIRRWELGRGSGRLAGGETERLVVRRDRPGWAKRSALVLSLARPWTTTGAAASDGQHRNPMSLPARPPRLPRPARPLAQADPSPTSVSIVDDADPWAAEDDEPAASSSVPSLPPSQPAGPSDEEDDDDGSDVFEDSSAVPLADSPGLEPAPALASIAPPLETLPNDDPASDYGDDGDSFDDVPFGEPAASSSPPPPPAAAAPSPADDDDGFGDFDDPPASVAAGVDGGFGADDDFGDFGDFDDAGVVQAGDAFDEMDLDDAPPPPPPAFQPPPPAFVSAWRRRKKRCGVLADPFASRRPATAYTQPPAAARSSDAHLPDPGDPSASLSRPRRREPARLRRAARGPRPRPGPRQPVRVSRPSKLDRVTGMRSNRRASSTASAGATCTTA